MKHYENRVTEGATVKGKAMFVCSSRPIAYDFYKEVIALRPEWAEVKACEEGAELTEQERKRNQADGTDQNDYDARPG